MALRFGEFELDPERRQLLRSGRPVPLEPKAYALLALLAERRPRALSRAQIRDAVWPGVFISESTLNQAVNSIRAALDDDAREPRYIRTAHGFGYAFCGEVGENGASPAVAADAVEHPEKAAVAGPLAPPRFAKWTAWIASATLVLGLLVAGGWRLRTRELPAPRLVQLTGVPQAMPGSLSPDDRQLAFASTGTEGDNWDIWLTVVGDSEVRRLTSDAANDFVPAWSPDGKQIAFVRSPPPPFKTPGLLYLVSPMGGPERRLADFLTLSQPSWSPDGRWLAASRQRAEGETAPESGGIQLLAVATGEGRPLTFPKSPATDYCPAFSPDGRSLAYATCEYPGTLMASCDLYVLPLDREIRAQGPSRRLTRAGFWASGVTWTRDGRSIIYGDYHGAHCRLFRILADGSSPPERIELAAGGLQPMAGHSLDRLVFSRVVVDARIHRLRPGAPETPFIQSTNADWNPQYSPDGRRVAFQSQRADERFEVWLADAEGTNATRLTRGPGGAQGAPRWSPDGRTIAFDSMAESGRFDVWTIGVDGSGLRQITRGSGDKSWASFSRDGRLIYYMSTRTGRLEIWRVPSAGGAEEQVTHEGGSLPVESADGRMLYYLRDEGSSNGQLLARPTQGGKERVVVPCVSFHAYAVGPQGVFHVGCEEAKGTAGIRRTVSLLDAAGRDREVGTFELPPGTGVMPGLSASPDGSSILYATAANLMNVMMIENFR
jgi:Tol biopolymer transport system component/DNA-binding winged helix-turn-helix (wHTH) protein